MSVGNKLNLICKADSTIVEQGKLNILGLENLIKVAQLKPFLKWAGGKSQLLNEIKKYYRFTNSEVTKYAEPFIGGGAVLFDILSLYDLQEVYISDINADLINTYKVIRDNIEELIISLKKLSNEFLPLNTPARLSLIHI